MAIAMSGFQGTAAYAIPLGSTGDITGTDRIAWHYKTATPYVPSPLLVGDRLYFTKWYSPILTCLDARTGKVLMEAQRLPGLKNLYASPVAAQRKDLLRQPGRCRAWSSRTSPSWKSSARTSSTTGSTHRQPSSDGRCSCGARSTSTASLTSERIPAAAMYPST